MHNNIILEVPWPPVNPVLARGNIPGRPPECHSTPYLDKPPPIINISLGRQLFVDDFLIHKRSQVEVSFNKLSIEGKVSETEGTGWLPGVVFDPLFEGGIYRMFVLCRESSKSDRNSLCHRTSTDGESSDSASALQTPTLTWPL